MERPGPTEEEKNKYLWKCAVILVVISAVFFYFALQIPTNWPVLTLLAVIATVVMGLALRFVLRKPHD